MSYRTASRVEVLRGRIARVQRRPSAAPRHANQVGSSWRQGREADAAADVKATAAAADGGTEDAVSPASTESVSGTKGTVQS